MKKMSQKNRYILTGCISLALICCILVLGIDSAEYASTSVEITETELNNTKIEWGIKRSDNHEQPDLGSTNKELIERYNGIALGNNDEPTIYLTFDLGYEAGYTSTILDALKEKNVKATFFITAHYLNTAPELVERMINEGHIIGNHTVNHKSMPSLTDDEITSELMTLNQTLYEKFGYEMTYMRPPKGEFSERTLSISENLGFKTVMWSFAYVDWNEDSQPSQEEALNKIVSNLHNGEVMLLHATSKTNSEIMSQLIDDVRNEGYEFKSLDEFR